MDALFFSLRAHDAQTKNVNSINGYEKRSPRMDSSGCAPKLLIFL